MTADDRNESVLRLVRALVDTGVTVEELCAALAVLEIERSMAAIEARFGPRQTGRLSPDVGSRCTLTGSTMATPLTDESVSE